MGDRTDIAEVDPVLELTFGACSLACTGTLNTHTSRHILEATEVLLEGDRRNVAIDVSGLRVADADGANALVAMQRMAADAGVTLRWRGLDAEHVMAQQRRDEEDAVGAAL